MIEKKVLFVGLARDCSNYLLWTLENIENISTLFSTSYFLFLENDSIDQTKHILNTWCNDRKNARVVNLDGFSMLYKERTIRLAAVRNTYIEIIKSDFYDFDYIIILDCDEINSELMEIESVAKSIHFLESNDKVAGIFANINGTYGDLWAFRHSQLCPRDPLEEVCDLVLRERLSDIDAIKQINAWSGISFDHNSPPIKVDSAFGWFGIYRCKSLIKNSALYIGSKKKIIPTNYDTDQKTYSQMEVGWQVCEHVSFNNGFNEIGEDLYILPYLVLPVRAISDPAAWRNCLIGVDINSKFLYPGYQKNVSLIGRNVSCPCGSGKRYKHCHGSLN